MGMGLQTGISLSQDMLKRMLFSGSPDSMHYSLNMMIEPIKYNFLMNKKGGELVSCEINNIIGPCDKSII